LLANNSDVNIVGIESREDRVKQADKRIENDKSKNILGFFLLGYTKYLI
jgi:tRNA G46 methylase TrmB